MSHVPPTESNLNPEEPQQSPQQPQFQQFQSQSKLLPIPIQIEEGLNRLRKEYATAPTLGCSSNFHLNPNRRETKSSKKV
ncbi:hypothetical protein TVAG_209840 [Trichomonas vaginalis G3]|uniref:Uncharacterized protein n=1 Tax=Trichomonas vaginalis (strain ATCC PRA-98 / G3) TaxID=412133 RepID=A2G8L7_TRIV3|nr:hypothetical protein TVAGG3_0574740 [Trichomonas vaginalis G3]EAX86496.1 hypothetical protein TVAG_209840 [Trichomonas vaginalis G3]KAI5522128.1 hypothetical protein TVAGG3_0574740 [Trichomonas vaginalis G3]|eukprot:XP_001299426.1 hypothetical protein [Trichomonas vaginalis G3]